jgi:hypothetical protein
MASRLQSAGLGKLVTGTNRKAVLPMVEIAPTGQNLQKIASALIEAFNDRRVELFDDPELRRDLNRLRVEERPYGFRLVSPRDQLGHGDLGTAFSLAMLAASERAAKRHVVIRSMESGVSDGSEYLSPGLRNALERFEGRQAIYNAEQRMLNRPEPTNAPEWWIDLMRECGRL